MAKAKKMQIETTIHNTVTKETLQSFTSLEKDEVIAIKFEDAEGITRILTVYPDGKFIFAKTT